ncbi:nitronate monooxygenase [Chryseolinea sp. H1M3-3]|uniref:NAD(P)H-dependent flavin oxidoreductase n=1 Tax=Chryseolinea sp. H1M3-3 TaxID=3034144 RepID=UPI0023EE0D22|nr:nitronate monooxygenase [Chryseolinea sp. H1M3-3]
MTRSNSVVDLFKIKIPVIQAGMVWCSGWRLAAAVSNAGGLGLIGAGSMYPDCLREHIRKCKLATDKPFGVNVPLLYPEIGQLMKIIEEEKVDIVFTSAGNPETWTRFLKARGIRVAHVVSSVKFAKKAEHAGVDAIVAEGFEAGGHNGREETTTFVLLPMVRDAISLPLIAAGGIATGRSILAAEALGADGFQVGSRFAVSEESSAHPNFKRRITALEEGGTCLSLKQLTPVRMVKNKFFESIQAAELRGASKEELTQLLGTRRSKLGIFEGDIEEGELEIGQVSSMIKKIQPASAILVEMWDEYLEIKKNMCS